MKRGEIYFANLDPTIGSEIKKTRPVLIISNNANNDVASTITVIPITSNTNKVYPFEVLLEKAHSGLPKESKLQCHQIWTISKLRINGKLAGTIKSFEVFEKIKYAIKLHLDLN